ncbi:hypothetical protein FIV42_15945 [Persicimonas caeni]|uniref:Uncharacterized protein n=1 Tax=Persicimonas caeni TaxID=2292766 RepID=A0A4Y6PVZ8_PERCE|nr:hypothetical protein [Persicimonas caeni]QDG52177.1 hypothetical protein FIV42_15945 [Persicimonas caeni]QED33399.1 hypothetical protein FRD00_15940 [Persicimonas caeni]
MDDQNYARLRSSLLREGAVFGVILPDGWFGRPYDNMLKCTGLRRANDFVEISLNDWVEVRIEGKAEVQLTRGDGHSGNQLEIGGFENAKFSYVPIGATTPVNEVYDSGQVVLVDLSS